VSIVQGCVEEVPKVQSREDKCEEEDRDGRIMWLQAPRAALADDRRNENVDLAQELLHKLACDDVSINHITRLGPSPSSFDDKTRLLKARFGIT